MSNTTKKPGFWNGVKATLGYLANGLAHNAEAYHNVSSALAKASKEVDNMAERWSQSNQQFHDLVQKKTAERIAQGKSVEGVEDEVRQELELTLTAVNE